MFYSYNIVVVFLFSCIFSYSLVFLYMYVCMRHKSNRALGWESTLEQTSAFCTVLWGPNNNNNNRKHSLINECTCSQLRT